MTGVVIFGLLIALMLTGMPISISLGLTVLTFLFTMTNVPLESVALKLFTGIEKFEIMAIPFFILAGNFLTAYLDERVRFAQRWHGAVRDWDKPLSFLWATGDPVATTEVLAGLRRAAAGRRGDRDCPGSGTTRRSRCPTSSPRACARYCRSTRTTAR